ncbi:hypothetical protein GCM10020331_020090 [Ectobacillus funiculus]
MTIIAVERIFIEDPLLVYMEPYASSTAELVTELLEYQPKRLKMSMLEATALLAGIIVDTKKLYLPHRFSYI